MNQLNKDLLYLETLTEFMRMNGIKFLKINNETEIELFETKYPKMESGNYETS